MQMRLLTMSLGGESYLNFMGNEFGHPEWIDFPREGNLNSYDKCRRRWDLADNPDLRYKYFQSFDRAMCHLDKAFGFMSSHHTYVSRVVSCGWACLELVCNQYVVRAVARHDGVDVAQIRACTHMPAVPQQLGWWEFWSVLQSQLVLCVSGQIMHAGLHCAEPVPPPHLTVHPT